MAGSRAPAANLLLATVAFALCFTAWSLLAPFAKTFKHDLGLDYTKALLLTAIPVVLGSLLRVPLGILTDRYGGRLVFTALLVFSAAPAVLFGYAHAYWALLAVGFLLGVAGASFAVGVPFVAGWYGRERQGFALGVYGMGNIGTAITFFGAPPVANHWGRATVGWAAAAGLLAAAALFFLLARNPPATAGPSDYGAVLRAGWRLYRLAFFYFITFGGFVAMGFLLPTLLQDWFGYSKSVAGARADYRASVGPWFRRLWYDPHPSLMANAPVAYQLHAAIPWLLYAVWPFSRLVHTWSYPLQYLGRPYILYRNLHPLPRRAGAPS